MMTNGMYLTAIFDDERYGFDDERQELDGMYLTTNVIDEEQYELHHIDNRLTFSVTELIGSVVPVLEILGNFIVRVLVAHALQYAGNLFDLHIVFVILMLRLVLVASGRTRGERSLGGESSRCAEPSSQTGVFLLGRLFGVTQSHYIGHRSTFVFSLADFSFIWMSSM